MMSCHNHDFIEIACLYRLKIKLSLCNGTDIIGIAQTTLYNNDKEECIVIHSKSETLNIVLTRIKAMSSLEANPHFHSVSFI